MTYSGTARHKCVFFLAASAIMLTTACSDARWNWWEPADDSSRRNAPVPVTSGSGNKQPTVTVVSEEERSDIVQVINFIPTNPWLVFDPLEGKVDGFKSTVYLAAPLKGERSGVKGFFGDGTIIVQMFRAEPDETTGKDRMELVHTWELPPEESYQWRARDMSILGWGYGLRLRWPEDLDVAGRKVSFLISYRRSDGRLISSSRPIVRRVPSRGM